MIIGLCPECGAEMRVGSDMTNADRIRSLSDEELAERFAILTDCVWCPCRDPYDQCDTVDGSCKKQWLDWLRKEKTMAEYIKREDVIERLTGLFQLQASTAKAIIESIPAADVRPVVLCRDCRHRDPEDHKCDSGEMERQGCPFKVADNYFCAYGER